MNLSKMVVMGLVMGTAVLLVGCPLQPVFFPDYALGSAVRHELKKPFGILTAYDLLKVKKLDAAGLGIEDLRGLKYCKNLAWLDLNTNRISDLSGLEYCKNLAWLDLSTNAISDLSPLDQFGHPESPFDSPLEYLILDGNEITDISALAALLNLQTVSLLGNQVADIGPLVVNAENMGLGDGDCVYLDAGPLNAQSLDEYVPTLVSLGVNIVGPVKGTGK